MLLTSTPPSDAPLSCDTTRHLTAHVCPQAKLVTRRIEENTLGDSLEIDLGQIHSTGKGMVRLNGKDLPGRVRVLPFPRVCSM